MTVFDNNLTEIQVLACIARQLDEKASLSLSHKRWSSSFTSHSILQMPVLSIPIELYAPGEYTYINYTWFFIENIFPRIRVLFDFPYSSEIQEHRTCADDSVHWQPRYRVVWKCFLRYHWRIQEGSHWAIAQWFFEMIQMAQCWEIYLTSTDRTSVARCCQTLTYLWFFSSNVPIEK